MLYRRFGKTDLQMPVVSFGGMRSMHTWKDDGRPIPETAESRLAAIVARALDHGITHIETAHGYGSSERQLGPILATHERSSFLLQTKAEPTEDPEEFVATVRESMTRLGVRRLDLLALHGINDYRSLWYSCRRNGCLAAARRLRDQGLVDWVGFSGHGPVEVIMQALEHREDDGFDFCNLHWYYIFDANRAALEYAAAHDLGLFIISPTDKGGHLHTPSPEMTGLCRPLSPMLFNDLYCLREPGVHTISVGAGEPDHFDEHLKVLPFLEAGDFSLVDQADTRLGAAMEAVCGSSRPDRHWDELPGWERCPGNLNLRMILWLSNLCRGWGLESYAKARYAQLGTGSSWVPGNNAAAAPMLDFSEIKMPGGCTAENLKTQLMMAHQLLADRDGC